MEQKKEKKRIWQAMERFDQLGITIVLAALVIMASFTNPTFYSAGNIINVLRSASFVFIIGIAITFVLITGGLDLSVGRVMAMAGILSAMAAKSGVPVAVSILTGLVFGLAAGLINGLLVVKLHIPALIVTG